MYRRSTLLSPLLTNSLRLFPLIWLFQILVGRYLRPSIHAGRNLSTGSDHGHFVQSFHVAIPADKNNCPVHLQEFLQEYMVEAFEATPSLDGLLY
jgi:hypothetical protein